MDYSLSESGKLVLPENSKDKEALLHRTQAAIFYRRPHAFGTDERSFLPSSGLDSVQRPREIKVNVMALSKSSHLITFYLLRGLLF